MLLKPSSYGVMTSLPRQRFSKNRLLPRRSRSGGFALVVTLSLMVLLTVIGLGLLSLSAVTMRATGQGSAQAEARANARLALLIAIGELQKQLGPDQRVSANGAILAESDVNHPHWTGVWDSWHAGPPDASAGSPDDASDHQTLPASRGFRKGMHPTYVENRKDHFRSWLVSLDPAEAEDISSASNLAIDGTSMPGKDATAVRLVGEGSLGEAGDGDAASEEDFVSARLLPLHSGPTNSAPTGRYGWWVGDESQKARIMHDSYESADKLSLADRLFRHQAPGSAGTSSVEGLENLTDDQQLVGLPSRQSLSLPDGATEDAPRNFHDVTPFSYQVLADVREGGLKRDLSTLLERPIRNDRSGVPAETSDEFMLYKFTTKDQWLSGPDNQECVPIHDLAAYYQLYDSARSGWKEGVRYASNVLPSGLQVVAPDFGDKPDAKQYLRNYTTLYRQPVPIKVQFLLSMFAEKISPAPKPSRGNPDPDTHQLLVGITPSVTLWNPTNLPLMMRFGDPHRFAQMMRVMNLPLHVRWIKNSGEFTSTKKNLFWFASGVDNYKPHIFNLYFSGKRQIRFEPGEVKAFSLPWSGDVSGLKSAGGYSGNWRGWSSEFFFKTDQYFEGHEVVEGWEPQSFMLYKRSAAGGAPHVLNNRLTFKAGDKIGFEVSPDNTALSAGNWIMFFMNQSNHQDYAGGGTWYRRNYQITGRGGGGPAHADFNRKIFSKGIRGRTGIIKAASRSGSNIITRANNEEGWPFLQFSFMAGTETSQASNGGAAGGRRFASRPFLHSTPIAASQLDGDDGNSLYNYGWNWWIEEINDVFEAPVQVSVENQGYYGGGYTPESGTTHVVQQEVPVTPPISIGALSHAHLGGFSIANDSVYYGYSGAGNPGAQRITATGQAGLFPHTLQAIGNSYAHPHIPAGDAWTNWSRTFKTDEGAKSVILADHSYLANKALWDEFFFSSISPRPSDVKVFGGRRNRSAEEVAEQFFFGEESLPNHRMAPYRKDFDEDRFAAMFKKAQLYNDGLADRIAARLMVEGPFNVNSTSVEAWRVLLSSLKGKSVAYLDKDSALGGGVKLDEDTPDGTPVASFSLPNGKAVTGSSSDPSDPDQWFGWRELSDSEIEELAEAIVRQVKLRGPFLSLSEFVNRRLDGSDKDLSVKGALQAALDDPGVSINAGFRSAGREMDSGEISKLNPAFREALQGPVAYGSAAYIDQADILRNFAAQLTPRGDTFVIRTYGDALNASGQVKARAWCEAVVQRVPDYSDPADEDHLRRNDLTSEANKSFGRKLNIVSFRWLNPSEV